MNKNFICECGNDKFWYFVEFVKCPECLNEYLYIEKTQEFKLRRFKLRRFNKLKNSYDKNMEKISIDDINIEDVPDEYFFNS